MREEQSPARNRFSTDPNQSENYEQLKEDFYRFQEESDE